MHKEIVVENCRFQYNPNRGVIYVFDPHGTSLLTVYGLDSSFIHPENLKSPGENIAEIVLRPIKEIHETLAPKRDYESIVLWAEVR